MRPSDVSAALSGLMKAKRPVQLWGPPGVGKSQVIQQCAKEAAVNFFDFRPLLHDPSDLKFPIVDVAARTVHWCNTIFPRDPSWEGIIVLEEIGLCAPLMQGALYQLVLDRKIGEYTLPDGAWVVATSNRAEDRAGVTRTSNALLNRFVHLDVEVSNDDWQAWAMEAGIAVEVRSFLNFRPHLLFHFDPKLNERAFPTPRSWAFVNSILPHTPQRLLHQVVSGTVGELAAAEFLGFLEVYRDLPDLDMVFKAPNKVTIPASRPAVMFAMCGALADKSRDVADLDNLGAFYLRKEMPSEFSALTLPDTFLANSKRVNGKPTGAPKLFQGSMGRWLAQHREVLLERTGA